MSVHFIFTQGRSSLNQTAESSSRPTWDSWKVSLIAKISLSIYLEKRTRTQPWSQDLDLSWPGEPSKCSKMRPKVTQSSTTGGMKNSRISWKKEPKATPRTKMPCSAYCVTRPIIQINPLILCLLRTTLPKWWKTRLKYISLTEPHTRPLWNHHSMSRSWAKTCQY